MISIRIFNIESIKNLIDENHTRIELTNSLNENENVVSINLYTDFDNRISVDSIKKLVTSKLTSILYITYNGYDWEYLNLVKDDLHQLKILKDVFYINMSDITKDGNVLECNDIDIELNYVFDESDNRIYLYDQLIHEFNSIENIVKDYHDFRSIKSIKTQLKFRRMKSEFVIKLKIFFMKFIDYIFIN